jgi:hypothetical protein
MDGHEQVGYDAAMFPLDPQPQTQAEPETPDQLSGLREEFPAFRIWREDAHGRTRFIACRQHRDQHPHTVITDDPAELRNALKPGAGRRLP